MFSFCGERENWGTLKNWYGFSLSFSNPLVFGKNWVSFLLFGFSILGFCFSIDEEMEGKNDNWCGFPFKKEWVFIGGFFMKLARACLVAENMEREENSIILCFLGVLNENPFFKFFYGGFLMKLVYSCLVAEKMERKRRKKSIFICFLGGFKWIFPCLFLIAENLKGKIHVKASFLLHSWFGFYVIFSFLAVDTFSGFSFIYLV